MSEAQTTTPPSLVLRRRYKAPRERVYAAWTTPAIAEKFLGPGETRASEIEMDPRVGGSYRITMFHSEGEPYIATGIYREVRPPARLSMTWRWLEDNPADEHETLLTLDFNDVDGETELVLTHERFASTESRDNHERGWLAILDQLEPFV
ncbi:MAG TPA: SRPBCC domain-containing protein [Candidatus Acidoferrales bacterium]|nr:SRPBCC domain-containing protein [Candidatus Acidoferrales bacterium]